jgi:hypothetical protein
MLSVSFAVLLSNGSAPCGRPISVKAAETGYVFFSEFSVLVNVNDSILTLPAKGC